MVDIDDILARYGLAEPPARPVAPQLIASAEARRQALLGRLAAARAAFDIIDACVANQPTDESAFVAAAQALGQILNEVGEAGMRFHGAAECVGEA